MTDKPWGGVFSQETDKRVEQFTESVSFDRRLHAHDIQGSKAHARMLAHVGLITPEEADQIAQALDDIEADIERGRFEFMPELEDIHMHIERALVDRLGDVGRKLHTGRSRNDQVSTDLRLWTRETIDRINDQLTSLQQAFVERCRLDRGRIVPAYTHMRRAQPVLAAHQWLAYCEKFQRDRDRLVDCRRRVNVLPLGAAAVAGTSLPIDRYLVAELLGFEEVAANSIDAASDRDFVLEFVFGLCLVALHLSGWAEEWIVWSTTEFGFLELPQSFCTGSSIMPHKVNPDVLELIRAKAARVAGSLAALMMLVKGLPLAYNRDLQEDKVPLFDAADTVASCLELAAPLVLGSKLRGEAIAATLDQGYLDATTLMEFLITRGFPQRSAHAIVGKLVRAAMDRGVSLAELTDEEIRSTDGALDGGIRAVLGAEKAVRAFASIGSTAPELVDEQVESWRIRLAMPKTIADSTTKD